MTQGVRGDPLIIAVGIGRRGGGETAETTKRDESLEERDELEELEELEAGDRATPKHNKLLERAVAELNGSRRHA